MTDFEKWIASKGYTLNSGISTHLIVGWVSEYERELKSKHQLKLLKKLCNANAFLLFSDDEGWTDGHLFSGPGLDSLIEYLDRMTGKS